MVEGNIYIPWPQINQNKCLHILDSWLLQNCESVSCKLIVVLSIIDRKIDRYWNIIFCMLKSFIFFVEQAFTLSLKCVCFFNSESNSSADLWRYKSQNE